MERFASLLLDVWREACQHIEIGESLERIAPLLARRMPLDWILVRRIDAARGSVETAAAAVCRPERCRGVAQRARAARARDADRLAREGRVLHRRGRVLAERVPG